MERLLCVVSIILLHIIIARAQTTRAVCVEYFGTGGVCEGGNLGTFTAGVNPGTATSRCCNDLSAGAFYDVDTLTCTSCNQQTYSCFDICGGALVSGGKADPLECCDAIEHGGLATTFYVDDLSGLCLDCTPLLVNRYSCFSSVIAGTCAGASLGNVARPADCCSTAGSTDYRLNVAPFTCFSCANLGGSVTCVDSADVLQQECGGQNVGVADDQNDCCAIGGAGGALARFGLFDFCFECSPPIMCYSDAACNNLIGTQKETLEECCDSFDDGGIEGLFYTVGSQCFTCAAIGDVDECSTIVPDVCGDGGTCTNTPGSYVCQCDPGYMPVSIPMDTCEDIDECDGANPCGNGVCNNIPGSYTCNCDAGFESNTLTCVDIDECTTTDTMNQHDCDLSRSTCDNTIGSFVCTCNDGFTNNMEGNCVDIDECDDFPGLCVPGGMCINNEDGGFYLCECDDGFMNNNGPASMNQEDCIDDDECMDDPSLCGAGSTCINLPNGNFYDCMCKPGTMDNMAAMLARTCVDIDECATDPTPCDPGTCNNVIDNFYTCTCEGGVRNNMGDATMGLLGCDDIDECTENPDLCGVGSTCMDLPDGQYYSCMCKPGTVSNMGDETMLDLTCEDIDECATDPTPCDPGTCNNVIDDFYTCTCEGGVRSNMGDATMGLLGCDDIDECTEAMTDPCGMNGVCNNLLMGMFYECMCINGFEQSGDPAMLALTCTDIDECMAGTDDCDDTTEVCMNTEGSFICVCAPGFVADMPGLCVDFDECNDPMICGVGTCTNNLNGGFYFCTCPDGYEATGMASELEENCTDIDECTDTPGICGGTSTCNNQPDGGFYTCTCGAGATLNMGQASMGTLTCEDIDECEVADMMGMPLCIPNGMCRNELDGAFYSCDCDPGFTEDGDPSVAPLTCVDLDECAADPTLCGATGTCSNIPDGMFYSCACGEGFRLNDGDPAMQELDCEDINECHENTHDCHPDAHCINIDGGFECECFEGFIGDGFNCKVAKPIPIWLWPLIRGSAGLDGLMGEKGEKGWPGEKGSTGPDGMPGDIGAKGDEGERGPQGGPGLDNVLQGEVGEKGDKGSKGSPGLAVIPSVVYVRWGHTDCPSTDGTERLCQGRAATARRPDSGSGANYLCLPDDPEFSLAANPGTVVEAHIAGVKYMTTNEPLQDVDSTGVPCAVCHTTRDHQLMIPGTAVCPMGPWRLEYNGYLMSSRDTPSATLFEGQPDANFRNEYMCVSANALGVMPGSSTGDDAEVYHVHLDCVAGASLGCDPAAAQQLTCAVCTYQFGQ